MTKILLVALNLSPLEISVILITGVGFVILFAISSSAGGYKELIDITLKNDRQRRLANKK